MPKYSFEYIKQHLATDFAVFKYGMPGESRSSIEHTIESYGSPIHVTSVTSSNPSIITVESDEYGYGLSYNSIGSATITVNFTYKENSGSVTFIGYVSNYYLDIKTDGWKGFMVLIGDETGTTVTSDLVCVFKTQLNNGDYTIDYQKGDPSKVTYEWSFLEPEANDYFSITANGDKATIKAIPQSSDYGYYSATLQVVGYINNQPAGEEIYHIDASSDYYEVTTSDGKSLLDELNKLHLKESYSFKPSLRHCIYDPGVGAKKEKVDDVEFIFWDYYNDPSNMKMTIGANNAEYSLPYDESNNDNWVDSDTEMHFLFDGGYGCNWLNIKARTKSDKNELYSDALNVAPMYARQLALLISTDFYNTEDYNKITGNEDKSVTLNTDWLEGINNYSIEWSVMKYDYNTETYSALDDETYTISNDGKTITLHGSNLKKYIKSNDSELDIEANAKVRINGDLTDLETNAYFTYKTSKNEGSEEDDTVDQPTVTPSPSAQPKSPATPTVEPTSQATPIVAPTKNVTPSAAPSPAVTKDKVTTFSIKNKAKVKASAKIKIKDKDKIKKITLNGKVVKIKKNKTSFTLKLKSYKKKLKKKGKWNTLKVTDNKGNTKTIKFKTK